MPMDLNRCKSLLQTYSKLNLGLADASVIATAERLGTRRIFTVDERHFRVILSATGFTFTLLPADA